jgi:hypothetical protein
MGALVVENDEGRARTTKVLGPQMLIRTFKKDEIKDARSVK